MAEDPRYYERNLPHLQPDDGVFFITFRLAGSLPKAKILALKSEHEQRIKNLRADMPNASDLDIKNAFDHAHDVYFKKFDDLLDNPESGPTHLSEFRIGSLVADCLMYWFAEKRYKLVCFTVMSNHVHVIFYKIQKPLFRILQTIKSFTGARANEILNHRGEEFWQRESYDRMIRNRTEFDRKVKYTLNNPVKAGLVEHWGDWQFTFLNPEFYAFAPE